MIRPVVVEMGKACTFPDCNCDSPYRAAGACVEPAQAAERAVPRFCTCDGAGRGPGRSCVVNGGGRLGDAWTCREQWEAGRAAVAALPAAPTLPEGWRAAPVEPTDAMVDATHHGQPVDDIWRDMLAAAPALPAAPAEPKTLTDEQIDRIAENCAKSMDGGIRGFMATWGWRQFARELLDVCAGYERAAPAQDPDNDPPAREASDWTPPADYDGDGSAAAMAASAAAPAPAARVDAPSMPMYGLIPWPQLCADISEAATGRRDPPHEFDSAHAIGHQPAPINMNSLNRIVSKYATAPAAAVVPSGMVLVPLAPTRAMNDVMAQDEWEWRDVLAAAEAVTLEQYEDAAAAAAVPVPLTADRVESLTACAFASTNSTPHTPMCQHWYRRGVRDAEQAHGIAQQPGGEHG